MKQVKPTLYKKTKTGAVNQWSIFTIGDTVVVEWGQVGGKLQSESYQAKPKNVGKANATTAEDQAIKEALAKYKKQLDKGYTEDKSGEKVVLLPMKVKDYWSNIAKVVFPCYWEHKYDGVNVLVYRVDGNLQFLSRGGTNYPVIDHLVDEINQWMDFLGTNLINGELYIHGEHLQDIQSAVKKFNQLTPRLVLRMFDLPLFGDEPYHERLRRFEGFPLGLAIGVYPPIPKRAETHEQLELAHRYAVVDGYEGIVIRNATAKYQLNSRSSDVFKMKEALDSEFLIVGYNTDKKGHAVFICETPEGLTFKVKCKGDDELRKKILGLAPIWVENKEYLKVEFENYSKDKIPLKPVGLWIRAMTDEGEVAE